MTARLDWYGCATFRLTDCPSLVKYIQQAHPQVEVEL
jgi:hypothetical protein